LNNRTDTDNIDAAYVKMEITDKVNSLYKEKIIELFEPILGKDGISVAVNTVIDFNKKTSEETTFTPVADKNGIISKQEYSRESTNGGTVPGGAPGAASNTGVPVYQQATGNGTDVSGSETASTEYLVNQLINSIQNDGGEIKDMTVSVLINNLNLTAQTLSDYRQVVANSVGIPVNKVIITAAEFKPAVIQTQPVAEKDLLTQVFEKYMYYILAGAGIILAVLTLLLIILIFLLARSRKKRLAEKKKIQEYINMVNNEFKKAQEAREAENSSKLDEADDVGRLNEANEDKPREIKTVRLNEVKKLNAAKDGNEDNEDGKRKKQHKFNLFNRNKKDKVKKADKNIKADEADRTNEIKTENEVNNIAELGEIVLNETREMSLKKRISDFSASNPEIVAQLIRTWLKDEK
jgi:flagellar biosynthesis/type III secretory pathway M-ring protein FliF/YscJ